MAVALASNPPTGRATPSVGATMATSGSSASLAASSAKELDEERQRLYQQLDDKVREREREKERKRKNRVMWCGLLRMKRSTSRQR